MQNELVGYKTSDQGKKMTINIMYHEAMHQYLHYYMGQEAEIPSWLNEGMGEYFFGGEFQPNGTFKIGLNRERKPVIEQAIRMGKYVSLDKIMKYTQAQYYADAHLCYAEGWSICYFLWRSNNPKYQGLIQTYMDMLRETKDKDKAHEAAFGNVDLRQMEEDWKKFILGL